jgi:hypothetical protein
MTKSRAKRRRVLDNALQKSDAMASAEVVLTKRVKRQNATGRDALAEMAMRRNATGRNAQTEMVSHILCGAGPV